MIGRVAGVYPPPAGAKAPRRQWEPAIGSIDATS